MFFPYIQSCEAHKQFGAEPAQYGLEINFNFDNFADLPTLTVWGINSRSHDLASKSHGESENLEIAKQFW